MCDDEVIWGGGIVRAYGHFLIESVSRLWPLLSEGSLKDIPIVWTTRRELPYIEDWCEAFGGKVVALPGEGVVRFKRIIFPEPAWRLNAWIAPEIRDIHLHARAGLDLPPFPKADVLWLSRSGLSRERVAYDEVLLEWLLREHVTIIHPETLSLGEQVAAIESSDAVAGIVGSAFHTMLMAKRMPKCVLLCAGRVRAAYIDQDIILGQRSTFVHALSSVEVTPGEKVEFPVKFPFGYRILIPEALRALSRTVLPGLLEDPRLEAFATPEDWSSGSLSCGAGEDLATAVARVLLDPSWMHARMELGRRFEEEGLCHCAFEQYAMVGEMSNEYAARASHYAARNLAKLGRSTEASEMAKRAISLDFRSQETAAAEYVI